MILLLLDMLNSTLIECFIANAQDSMCSRNYTVVSGDTCNGISAAQDVSTSVYFFIGSRKAVETHVVTVCSFQLALDNPDVAASGCVDLQIGQVSRTQISREQKG